MQDPILYGDFRNALKDDEERFYEDQVDYQRVSELFTEVNLIRMIFFAL